MVTMETRRSLLPGATTMISLHLLVARGNNRERFNVVTMETRESMVTSEV